VIEESDVKLIEANSHKRMLRHPNQTYGVIRCAITPYASCLSNVADVLDMVGIQSYDSRGLGVISPQDIAVGLSKSKRVYKKNLHKKQ
jgi:hypothetical protein